MLLRWKTSVRMGLDGRSKAVRRLAWARRRGRSRVARISRIGFMRRRGPGWLGVRIGLIGCHLPRPSGRDSRLCAVTWYVRRWGRCSCGVRAELPARWFLTELVAGFRYRSWIVMRGLNTKLNRTELLAGLGWRCGGRFWARARTRRLWPGFSSGLLCVVASIVLLRF